MKKRGQLQISFGMIFSIIIIIAIVGVAIYVITYFLNLNKCTETGTFKQKLQERIDQAYTGGKTQDTFNSATLPSGVKYICFGSYNNGYLGVPTKEEREVYVELKKYSSTKYNMYLYPPKKACDSQLSRFSLVHMQTPEDKFFCIEISSGIGIKISKSVEDALVTISK